MSNVSEHNANTSFFKTYRYVLQQKKKFDDHLLSLQEQLLSMVQSKKMIVEDGDRKAYVPRVDNSKILLEAILSVMVPRKEMTMSEVMRRLEKKNAYRTNSSYFYTMVNNKLNRQDLCLVGPIRRGVYIYKPTKAQLRKMEAYHQSTKDNSSTSTKSR